MPQFRTPVDAMGKPIYTPPAGSQAVSFAPTGPTAVSPAQKPVTSTTKSNISAVPTPRRQPGPTAGGAPPAVAARMQDLYPKVYFRTASLDEDLELQRLKGFYPNWKPKEERPEMIRRMGQLDAGPNSLAPEPQPPPFRNITVTPEKTFLPEPTGMDSGGWKPQPSYLPNQPYTAQPPPFRNITVTPEKTFLPEPTGMDSGGWKPQPSYLPDIARPGAPDPNAVPGDFKPLPPLPFSYSPPGVQAPVDHYNFTPFGDRFRVSRPGEPAPFGEGQFNGRFPVAPTQGEQRGAIWSYLQNRMMPSWRQRTGVMTRPIARGGPWRIFSEPMAHAF